jgi:two-component system, NarL family, response regulator NreC
MVQGPIRVMCMDDNDLLAGALQRWLSTSADIRWAGWVSDCDRPEEQVRAVRPDVLLLDVAMPGCDGFELAARISRECPGVRVVIFSGHLRSDYIDRAFEAGAHGYISKDDTLADIIAAVRATAQGAWAMSPSVRALAAGPR